MAQLRAFGLGTLGVLTLMIHTFCATVVAQSEPETPATIDAPGLPPASPTAPVQILTDTRGVDFGLYLSAVTKAIKRKWYQIIPPQAMPPLLKQGKVVVEFAIMKDGKVSGLHYTQTSGDVAFDRAAYGGITASSPFAPLAAEFKGPYLGLRFTFYYNPTAAGKETVVSSAKSSTPPPDGSVEAVRLSEILLSMPMGSAERIEALRAKAIVLLARLRAGLSFEKLAQSNFDDVFEGDLGYFERGKLAEPLEDIVFAMKPGDLSNVIETKQGFIILKVTEHRGAPPTDLSKSSSH